MITIAVSQREIDRSNRRAFRPGQRNGPGVEKVRILAGRQAGEDDRRTDASGSISHSSHEGIGEAKSAAFFHDIGTGRLEIRREGIFEV